jgi:hypothetical protein
MQTARLWKSSHSLLLKSYTLLPRLCLIHLHEIYMTNLWSVILSEGNKNRRRAVVDGWKTPTSVCFAFIICMYPGSVNPNTKSQLLFWLNKIKISTHIPTLTYSGQHNE